MTSHYAICAERDRGVIFSEGRAIVKRLLFDTHGAATFAVRRVWHRRGGALDVDQGTVRVLEKLSHLGLSIALDNAVAVTQKQVVCLGDYPTTRRSLTCNRSWTCSRLRRLF